MVFVSWNDAARFVNWLSNRATAGASTETGTYTMANGSGVTRNVTGSVWFLPNENEWYKAAYYSGNGTNGSYYAYPTRSNTAPDNNQPADDSGNSANYYVNGFTQDISYPASSVGAYTLSPSAYGTFDQGGNVWEWTETQGSGTTRVRRGGSFDSDGTAHADLTISSAYRETMSLTGENDNMGFRVASIPLLAGDYNANGVVDAADYVVWRKYLNQSALLPGDVTPGSVTQSDYSVWRAHFGQTYTSVPARAACFRIPFRSLR